MEAFGQHMFAKNDEDEIPWISKLYTQLNIAPHVLGDRSGEAI